MSVSELLVDGFILIMKVFVVVFVLPLFFIGCCIQKAYERCVV